jgi:hypothetical protein
MAQPVQQLNQFAQKTLKGEVAAIPNPATLSCIMYPSSSNILYAGDAVVLYPGTSNQIMVDLAAATDVPFGIVIRNPKKASFEAADALEIALPGSVVVVESYSTFNRGQNLTWYPTGLQFKAAVSGSPSFGIALDTSTATGQLVRMYVRSGADFSSSSSSSSCRSSSSSSSSSAAA